MSAILTFAGVGSAFAPKEFYQTNAVITEGGKHLLIDCGSDARFSLAEIGVEVKDIHGVYLSHLHADHAGGLEWLGFVTYFTPKQDRPVLYAVNSLIPEVWYSTLRGGMESLQGKIAKLEDYFEPLEIYPNEGFTWGSVTYQPVQTVHIVSGRKFMHTYGLMMSFPKAGGGVVKVFYTGDTQFAPNQLMHFYTEADWIFQDCETTPYRSGVHAHFEELRDELPTSVKGRMRLMHYQPDGKFTDADVKKAGFLGFVKRGQQFEFGVR